MVLSKNQSWEQKYAIFAWISLLSSYPGNNQHLLQKDNRKSRISRHTAYCTKLCCSHACALPCFLMILTCGLNFQDWPQTCLIIMTCLATWPLLVLPDLLCSPSVTEAMVQLLPPLAFEEQLSFLLPGFEQLMSICSTFCWEILYQ